MSLQTTSHHALQDCSVDDVAVFSQCSDTAATSRRLCVWADIITRHNTPLPTQHTDSSLLCIYTDNSRHIILIRHNITLRADPGRSFYVPQSAAYSTAQFDSLLSSTRQPRPPVVCSDVLPLCVCDAVQSATETTSTGSTYRLGDPLLVVTSSNSTGRQLGDVMLS